MNVADRAGMAAVRAASDIPIAAGESEFTRFDLRDLLEHGAVGSFQPGLGEENFEVVDGMIAIPDRPGLGVAIDEVFLAAHPVD